MVIFANNEAGDQLLLMVGGLRWYIKK